MLVFAKKESPQKCFFTSGTLPRYIDPSQPPQTRKPFSSLWSMKWCHTLDVVLPAEIGEIVQRELDRDSKGRVGYAKVMMSLRDLVDGEFFDEYIKKGNIMMLSEGRPGVDNLYSLHDGILRIEVDKATYERIGIVGKPIADGGLKHKKNRFLIEQNLRLPSMVSGKKAFDRMKWAFKTVLNESLTWLFYDCSSAPRSIPLETHHPLHKTSAPSSTPIPQAIIPSTLYSTSPPSLDDDDDLPHDLYEYLSLLSILSPRVLVTDSIDPYLSRYTPPSPSTPADLVRLRWHGFLPSRAVVQILIAVLKATPASQWVSCTAHGFRDESATVLRLPREEDEEGGTFWAWELPAAL